MGQAVDTSGVLHTRMLGLSPPGAVSGHSSQSGSGWKGLGRGGQEGRGCRWMTECMCLMWGVLTSGVLPILSVCVQGVSSGFCVLAAKRVKLCVQGVTCAECNWKWACVHLPITILPPAAPPPASASPLPFPSFSPGIPCGLYAPLVPVSPPAVLDLSCRAGRHEGLCDFHVVWAGPSNPGSLGGRGTWGLYWGGGLPVGHKA